MLAAAQELKLELDASMSQYTSKKGAGVDKAAFREACASALERRLFYVPSYKIYGGVAGLYDFGPPGCAVKSNLLQQWRQHFVLEENMLEIECPAVTPECVLRASGHVEKFTDLMVRDVKTHQCYRADHLLEGHLEPMLEDPTVPRDQRKAMELDLNRTDEMSPEELGGKLESYRVKAPDTGNDLTAPFPFNLMFATQIGPMGNNQGFFRPETAQGIFVNFRDLLYYNGGRLPFAGAQVGRGYRNEIAPRQGLLRVREFEMAEIEHFVNPDKKDHPRFSSVADLEPLLFARAQQAAVEKPVAMKLGDAVRDGIIANETLGYFIGRTYLFLKKVGIDPTRLRFRQHLQHEMAHYACDCWDAEIECSYGWVECVGLADRSAYDLTAHSAATKVDLSAHETFAEPVMEEVLEIKPNKKDVAKAFKRDTKLVTETLEAMDEAEAMAMAEAHASGADVSIKSVTTGQEFTITPGMVAIAKKTKKVTGRSFVPSVIEPSFGIGRVLYMVFEHSFYVREDDDQKTVFKFPAVMAPTKCALFPLQVKKDFEPMLERISRSLVSAGVSNKIDDSSASIGKRYARFDELGVPFAVTVDFDSLTDDTVTLRERDSTTQLRLPADDVADLLMRLSNGSATWEEAAAKYPAVTAKE